MPPRFATCEPLTLSPEQKNALSRSDVRAQVATVDGSIHIPRWVGEAAGDFAVAYLNYRTGLPARADDKTLEEAGQAVVEKGGLHSGGQLIERLRSFVEEQINVILGKTFP